MPSKTFFNLKEEKKERIEKALVHEFSKRSFEQTSITNIIKEAKIPRGSFYQYFEDKKDAMKYLVEKFILIDYKKMQESLEETKGDIFETTLKTYDYRISGMVLDFDIGLVKNILEELRKNNFNVFENNKILKDKNTLINLIDKTQLNLKSEKDLYHFIRIITAITSYVTMEVLSKRLSKEDGRKTLEIELEILKNGMKK